MLFSTNQGKISQGCKVIAGLELGVPALYKALPRHSGFSCPTPCSVSGTSGCCSQSWQDLRQFMHGETEVQGDQDLNPDFLPPRLEDTRCGTLVLTIQELQPVCGSPGFRAVSCGFGSSTWTFKGQDHKSKTQRKAECRPGPTA